MNTLRNDPRFGTHYVLSAADLAIQAGRHLGASLKVSNVPEAIRLYEAAIADATMAIEILTHPPLRVGLAPHNFQNWHVFATVPWTLPEQKHDTPMNENFCYAGPYPDKASAESTMASIIEDTQRWTEIVAWLKIRLEVWQLKIDRLTSGKYIFA